MRSIFEDTELQAALEDKKSGGNKTLPVTMWAVAIIFIVLTFTIYRIANNRPVPPPPPPPVTLEDSKQTTAAFSKFNGFLYDGNWAEAEKLLSTAAQQRLKDENKTLAESMFGKRKDSKVLEGVPTPNTQFTPERFQQEYAYRFADQEIVALPLTLIIENGRIVLDTWSEQEPTSKPANTPSSR